MVLFEPLALISHIHSAYTQTHTFRSPFAISGSSAHRIVYFVMRFTVCVTCTSGFLVYNEEHCANKHRTVTTATTARFQGNKLKYVVTLYLCTNMECTSSRFFSGRECFRESTRDEVLLLSPSAAAVATTATTNASFSTSKNIIKSS